MSVADYFDTMNYAPALEDDKPAREWIAAHGGRFGHFIAGRFTDPEQTFATRNPANGEVLAEIAQGTPADIDAAVTAARKAQKGWEAIGPAARARHLYALARTVQRNARLLAVLETLDNGKPIRESRDIDIPLVARHFYHHAGWAKLRDTEFPGQRPLGVVGQVIPWNFPLLMLAWKLAPALAMGNTVVLKPAEFTPLTAMCFAEIARAAGLPDGVLNIVNGDGTTGAALVAHEGIDKVAFTGSTEVGRLIREQTAGSGKALTLELGGKSPFIVFDDADLDAAVEGVVDSIWFNQGQVCCAGSRILVQEGVADDFLTRLRARMDKLRVGNGLDKTVDMGAVVAPVQLARTRAMVADGVADGATLYQPACDLPGQGCFYPPTLLSGVEPASAVATEEIFGPVVVSMTFRTPGEAVELANHSRYGLAASVWSESVNLALEIAAKVSAGVVWVNGVNMLDAAVGFGGMRESGFGREGGREGCFAYLAPAHWDKAKPRPAVALPQVVEGGHIAPVDRTAKLFIGGKQARPDGGYVRPVLTPKGKLIAHVADGNRKDIRNAVEAAQKAAAWSGTSSHSRAQILYYIAENLSARSEEFMARISDMTGAGAKAARVEVDAAIDRLFSYGAWADKYEGAVHEPPLRGIALAMNEPVGVVGVICPPEAPLLGLVSLVAPLIAMGNRVVAVPSTPHPLSATDFYSVLETSDLPGGVVNIVTGDAGALADVLAAHGDVDGLWAFGSADLAARAERLSAGNLKRVFTDRGRALDWFDDNVAEGREFLRHACEVKNIWVPYGE